MKPTETETTTLSIKQKTAIYLIAAALTVGIIIPIFAILGLAPFGERALIYSDGQHQMVDLFAWYKDVLAGKASIDFSFSKSLGGSNFAVFTYYLSSPVSLLIVFFNKAQTSLFMNVIFSVKAILASVFTVYYLLRKHRTLDRSAICATILLSVSYGLGHFLIAQSSNTMWLDGAYMLPLILAGCEKITSGKRSTLFIVSSALAICFNWYSGIVDLMFACFWMVFDLIRRYVSGIEVSSKDNPDPKSKRNHILFTFVHFAVSGICAVLLSAALLLPTLMMLSGRSHGSGGLSLLKNLSMIGSVTDVVATYSFGMISVKGTASLFAGSFALIGTILLFTASTKTRKEKLTYGGLLLFTVLTYVWQPLVALFSLLRIVESYWYRYSYIGSFVLIYLAAEYYLSKERTQTKASLPLLSTGVYLLLVILFSKITLDKSSDIVFAAIMRDLFHTGLDFDTVPMLCKLLFPSLTVIAMALILHYGKKPVFRNIFCGLLAVIVLVDLAAGQLFLGWFYSLDNGDATTEYARNELTLLKNLPEEDSFYRVVQTTYHGIHNDQPASYNEPMAYRFHSIASFVSDPDEDTVFFLDRGGYCAHSDTITNTSFENLALDSLLGVRYVILPAGDPNTTGLIYTSGLTGFKDIYTNPYALPVAFVYDGTGSYESSSTAPVLYVNDLYSHLSGYSADMFVPADYEEAAQEEGANTFFVSLPDEVSSGDYILYANFPTSTSKIGSKILRNDEMYTVYSYFMAPKLIRVYTGDCVAEGKVKLQLVFNESSEETADETPQVTDVQFYFLDLSKLKEVTDSLRANACTNMELRDRYGRFEVEGTSGQSLFTSIPVEKGWSVTRNGKKIEPDLIGSTLYSIPLENGKNVIEMHYDVPYKKAGIAISIFGLLMLAGLIVTEGHYRRKKEAGA
ncbi:MAG: YfhO family protein [Clostridiales bacterium]|nr:YfhO family protein [Clostridiales bacterium]